MFKRKLEFRFTTKIPFWKKLHLMDICSSTDLDAPGYSGIIALMTYVKEKYHLNCSISFCDGITTFRFEALP